MAEFDLQPGRRVFDKIEKKLMDCDAVVAIITPSSSNSQWVLFELGMASLSRKPLIPVVQLGSDVPKPLTGIEYVAFDPNDTRPTLEVVARYLGTLRDRWQTVQTLKELAMAGGFLAGLKLLDYLERRKDES